MESQELYNKQLLAADIITYVDTLDMYRTNIPDGFFDRNKLMNRNKYMIDNSDVLIALKADSNFERKKNYKLYFYKGGLYKDFRTGRYGNVKELFPAEFK